MPLPYSDDLRWRIVWKHLFLKVDAEDVAKEMFVSARSVYRYAERFLSTGDVKLFAKKNGPFRVLCEHEEYIVVPVGVV